MTNKRKAFLIVSLLWMVLIFYMSSQPADESTQTSLRAGRAVCTVFVPGYRKLPADRKMDLARKIDHPVRKTAHATEYAVLGILAFQVFQKRRYRKSVLTAACYASTDEFHQLFVQGRSGQVTDVMIDTCGAAAGLLIVFLIRAIRQRKSEEKKS